MVKSFVPCDLDVKRCSQGYSSDVLMLSLVRFYNSKNERAGAELNMFLFLSTHYTVSHS